MKKKVVILLFAFVLSFLSGCNLREKPHPSHFDNETPYVFKEVFSAEEIESWKYQGHLYNKNHPFRSCKNNYYLVYYLDDNSLAYVFYEYLPYTGITFAPKETVIYPSEDIDKTFYKRILEMDYPETLLERIEEASF